MSFYERQSLVEASLGGRVTAEEIRVFGDELLELLEGVEGQGFSLLLDHSKAKRLDGDAILALAEVKDRCFAHGAETIVSVPIDEQDSVLHQSMRLQYVLEGKEQFVYDPRQAQFPIHKQVSTRKVA